MSIGRTISAGAAITALLALTQTVAPDSAHAQRLRWKPLERTGIYKVATRTIGQLAPDDCLPWQEEASICSRSDCEPWDYATGDCIAPDLLPSEPIPYTASPPPADIDVPERVAQLDSDEAQAVVCRTIRVVDARVRHIYEYLTGIGMNEVQVSSYANSIRSARGICDDDKIEGFYEENVLANWGRASAQLEQAEHLAPGELQGLVRAYLGQATSACGASGRAVGRYILDGIGDPSSLAVAGVPVTSARVETFHPGMTLPRLPSICGTGNAGIDADGTFRKPGLSDQFVDCISELENEQCGGDPRYGSDADGDDPDPGKTGPDRGNPDTDSDPDTDNTDTDSDSPTERDPDSHPDDHPTSIEDHTDEQLTEDKAHYEAMQDALGDAAGLGAAAGGVGYFLKLAGAAISSEGVGAIGLGIYEAGLSIAWAAYRLAEWEIDREIAHRKKERGGHNLCPAINPVAQTTTPVHFTRPSNGAPLNHEDAFEYCACKATGSSEEDCDPQEKERLDCLRWMWGPDDGIRPECLGLLQEDNPDLTNIHEQMCRHRLRCPNDLVPAATMSGSDPACSCQPRNLDTPLSDSPASPCWDIQCLDGVIVAQGDQCTCQRY